MWTSNNWIACLLLCEYKLRHKHIAHECIQQLTSESVKLIYNSGSDVPMNLLCSQKQSEGVGGSIISPAGALSGVHVWDSEEIEKKGT